MGDRYESSTITQGGEKKKDESEGEEKEMGNGVQKVMGLRHRQRGDKPVTAGYRRPLLQNKAGTPINETLWTGTRGRWTR